MRTTITLTPEADGLVRKLMREHGLTFQEAVNTAIVDGLSASRKNSSYRTPTFDLGRARVPLDEALAVAGELEDEQLRRKAEAGK